MPDSSNYSRQDLRQLQRRITSMIDRGVVTNVNDALMMQTLDVELKSGFKPTKVEHWHPYGMSYHPHAEAEVLALSLGGNPDHVIVIPGADRRYRLKSLGQGEVALHDDQGQKVHMTRGGVVVESAKGITIKGPLRIEGDITHLGNMTTSGTHTDANGPHTA